MPSREQLEQLLADDPTDVFLVYAVAMAWASEGDADQAIERLGKLLEEQPDYVPAWFQRGQLLAGADRVQEAREVLVEGIAVARRVGDAHAEGEMAEFLESL
jgi:predicted Zn-dependent protease